MSVQPQKAEHAGRVATYSYHWGSRGYARFQQKELRCQEVYGLTYTIFKTNLLHNV